ncbi:MAG: mannose-1-phosphate guanylyltransferase [Saprospiraceae bacterium]|nr:mannose-1-phosphate guanylyltransferase [Saprospiraceae bacterium]
MQRDSIFSVILAGGVGSRFWPLSRNNHPKQFLDILGTGKSLLQLTWDRLLNVSPASNILIVTHKDYFELVKNQLPDVLEENILLEPERKNTAPCILYAALVIQKINPNALMFVAPSDHLILQSNQFILDVEESVSFLKNEEGILTLGIQVSRPDTGYGYIEFDPESEENNEVFKVSRFVEKPDRNLAIEYMNTGRFLWNSGMFLWSIPTILSAFQEQCAAMYQLFEKNGLEQIEKVYQECENISIDYAILENYNKIFVKRVDFGWSDLGTWGSVYGLIQQDEFANTSLHGKQILLETSGCMIYNEGNQILATYGIRDLIIINTTEAILVLPRNEEQSVKKLVQKIESQFGNKFL